MPRLTRSFLVLSLWLAAALVVTAQPAPPVLTQPVNDFAGVIDTENAARLDSLIRQLQGATGDVIVIATIETFAPYADIREYAVRMFENRGRGIGGREKDNGLLVLLAVKDRSAWIEVGYGLEEFVTDGFAGETSREVMAPAFRRNEYGAGLLAGAERLAARIARGRGIDPARLGEGVAAQARGDDQEVGGPGGCATGLIILLLLIFVIVMMTLSTIARLGGHRRRRSWAAGPWSGWNSGVGSFGSGRGGFGGGFGGFGGFGGGRSGGGGGGASW